MVLVALLVGVILLIAALRNSQGALFTALGKDVPGFVIWAAALVAVGIIGFIPGLKPISRGLLALVFIVLIVRNYQQAIAGFQNAWQNPPASGGGTPAAPASAASSLLNSISPSTSGNAGSTLEQLYNGGPLAE